MPAAAIPSERPGRQQRSYPLPLPALAAAELAEYRRELERAIAFFGRQRPVPPVHDDLQAKLGAVLAEIEAQAGTARA